MGWRVQERLVSRFASSITGSVLAWLAILPSMDVEDWRKCSSNSFCLTDEIRNKQTSETPRADWSKHMDFSGFAAFGSVISFYVLLEDIHIGIFSLQRHVSGRFCVASYPQIHALSTSLHCLTETNGNNAVPMRRPVFGWIKEEAQTHCHERVGCDARKRRSEQSEVSIRGFWTYIENSPNIQASVA